MSKELFAALEAKGLTEYGAIIPADFIRGVLGLVLPEVGRKADFDAVALAEMSGVDYVRNILLGQGKYLASSSGNYRILLPSENARQVEQYVSQADRKLRRALKLNRNTPQVHAAPHQTDARIVMKMQSARRHPNAKAKGVPSHD